MSIHVVQYYTAVKKEVKLKDPMQKLLLDNESKREIFAQYDTFFYKNTQNTLYFLFYTY